MAASILSSHVYAPLSTQNPSLAYTLYTPSPASVAISTPAPLSAAAASTPTSSPPTVLLLPFWGGTADTYKPLQLALARSHPQNASIAVTYRSQIPSASSSVLSAQDADPSYHSVSALANDVITFLLDTTIRTKIPLNPLVVVGHSMGGKIALVLTSLLSKSASIHLASLILLAPAPPSPLVLPAEMRTQQLSAYTTSETAQEVIQNVLSCKVLKKETVETLAQGMVRMSEAGRKGWLEKGMGEDVRDVVKAAGLRGLKTKVIVGGEDVVEAPERVQRETVGWLKDDVGMEVVEVKVLQGVGHLLPLEALEEVKKSVGEMLREGD